MIENYVVIVVAFVLQGVFIVSALDNLSAQVAASVAAESAAVAFIKDLMDKLSNAAGDPAALDALTAQLKASADLLVGATQPPVVVPPPVV